MGLETATHSCTGKKLRFQKLVGWVDLRSEAKTVRCRSNDRFTCAMPRRLLAYEFLTGIKDDSSFFRNTISTPNKNVFSKIYDPIHLADVSF